MPTAPKKLGKRDFRGRRWLSIGLRCVHLVGVVMLGAALLTSGEQKVAGGLVLATGLAMYGLDVWCNPKHLGELAGVFILVKLLLVGALLALPGAAIALFWGLILGSSVVSHAPAHFRHIRVFD